MALLRLHGPGVIHPSTLLHVAPIDVHHIPRDVLPRVSRGPDVEPFRLGGATLNLRIRSEPSLMNPIDNLLLRSLGVEEGSRLLLDGIRFKTISVEKVSWLEREFEEEFWWALHVDGDKARGTDGFKFRS